MSQLFVTGPAEIYVGAGGSGLEFLGYTDEGVRIQLQGAFEDVFADLGGRRVPIDSLFMGEQAVMTCNLIRFNELVYKHCAKRIPSQSARGTYLSNKVGTLMIQEAEAYRVLIDAPYRSKTAFLTMEAYNFPTAWLDAGTDIGTGTKAKTINCIFRALPAYSLANTNFPLYNNSVTGKPSVD